MKEPRAAASAMSGAIRRSCFLQDSKGRSPMFALPPDQVNVTCG